MTEATVYAVGDIHGRADLVAALHKRIDADLAGRDAARAIEIYVGDYVDRGDGTCEVLDRLIERAKTRRAVFLRGNHEATLLDFLEGNVPLDLWRSFGGLQTIASYGVDPRQDADKVREDLVGRMPPAHMDFLRGLKDFEVIGPYVFVHAGLRPGVPLERQAPDDLMWIREEFLDHQGSFGHVVVHGHTPARAPELRHNRINVDTGAFATNTLTCVRIDAAGVTVL